MPRGRIAYTHTREDGTTAIYLMKPDGTDRRCLVDTAGPDALPAWSPDGRSIAFRGGSSADQADIYIVRADGTGLRQLTDTAAWEGHPIWSPDGRRVAYQRSHLPDEPPWSIRVMDSTGTADAAILSSGHAVAWAELHDWSPDGRTLLLFVDNGGGGNLSAMRPDGTNLRLLRAAPGDFGSGAVYSPDGESIVFQADLNGGCIYRSDSQARHLVHLTHGCSTGFRLSWSPDGEQIIWAGGDGPADLQSMLRDGSQQRTIVDSADVADVDWQPRTSN
jgi:TolB protein